MSVKKGQNESLNRQSGKLTLQGMFASYVKQNKILLLFTADFTELIA